MIGPNMTPIPQTAMARPCRSGGLMSSSTACDIGTSAAPPRPCRPRNSTICGNVCASPHSTEATVKTAIEMRNIRLRPNCPASQPLRGIMIAVAMM